jgi:malate dehydrogenase (oxaloacetate-decarboxylating)(NADP+)
MSTDQAADAKEKLRNDALHYHRYPQPGKLEVVATKPSVTSRWLVNLAALAVIDAQVRARRAIR